MTDSMQRREFFRRSALVAAGVVAARVLPSVPEPASESFPEPVARRDANVPIHAVTGHLWISKGDLCYFGSDGRVYKAGTA